MLQAVLGYLGGRCEEAAPEGFLEEPPFSLRNPEIGRVWLAQESAWLKRDISREMQ